MAIDTASTPTISQALAAAEAKLFGGNVYDGDAEGLFLSSYRAVFGKTCRVPGKNYRREFRALDAMFRAGNIDAPLYMQANMRMVGEKFRTFTPNLLYTPAAVERYNKAIDKARQTAGADSDGTGSSGNAMTRRVQELQVLESGVADYINAVATRGTTEIDPADVRIFCGLSQSWGMVEPTDHVGRIARLRAFAYGLGLLKRDLDEHVSFSRCSWTLYAVFVAKWWGEFGIRDQGVRHCGAVEELRRS